ncbi:hypothetical protein [Nocardia sp. CA-120079]|uniref:hypothetical protein n=1 Tax=Nocardia sp. CA-120079 TaxID=3239974 RepID=UPI003D952FC3
MDIGIAVVSAPALGDFEVERRTEVEYFYFVASDVVYFHHFFAGVSSVVVVAGVSGHYSRDSGHDEAIR